MSDPIDMGSNSDPEKRTALEEVLPTLDEDTQKCIASMVQGANHFFDDDGEVPPAVSCVNAQGIPNVYPAIHANDIEKQCVWGFIRFLRETHPIVLLISEVFASKITKDQLGKPLPMPSNDPNRTEMVMISVWERNRTLWIAADITRNPNKLGEFSVRFDTIEDGSSIGGELAKGEAYKGKEMYGSRGR